VDLWTKKNVCDVKNVLSCPHFLFCPEIHSSGAVDLWRDFICGRNVDQVTSNHN
jgi:hypothetical protein